MKSKLITVFAASVALCGCATEYSISPVPGASQQLRYEQGVPTIYSEQKAGVIQITPVGISDDMRLAFGVAAFNKVPGPSNLGVENISLTQEDGSSDKIFTSGELVHEAKVRAQWAEFATALAGGLAAANSYSTTTGTAYTPIGPVSYHSRSYDAVGAAEIRSVTSENLASIRNSLDHTISGIRGSMLQTTTINAGDSYGGIVVAEKLSSSKYPQQVSLHVNWNGEDHAFNFVVAEGAAKVVQGAAAPAPNAPPPARDQAMVETKLPYGYSDNSQEPVAATPSSPQFVSFDQWDKSKKNAKP
jgi:hypothetical protein